MLSYAGTEMPREHNLASTAEECCTYEECCTCPPPAMWNLSQSPWIPAFLGSFFTLALKTAVTLVTAFNW